MLANAKHEAVALAYLADPHKIGWRAYRQVYPKSSRKSAEEAFSRLSRNVKFAARVAETHKEAAQATVMAAQEVLEELSKLARANMLNYMKVGGDGDPVLNFAGLTRDQAAGLIQVEVEDFKDGRGDDARDVRKVRFRLGGKVQALELLGKHHKLYTERHEHSVGEGLADRLAEALARVDAEDERERKRVDADGDEVRPHRDPPRRRHAGKAARKSKRTRA